MKSHFMQVKIKVYQKLILYLMISVLFSDCNSQEFVKDDHSAARKKMVESQIISRGIKDQDVIDAMLKVERHLFVSPEYANQSYGDYPLPIGDGQTISQPYIVALMTEVLDVNKSSRVLEIGTGSGYQAAILSRLCDTVYTIEIFESLGKKAQNILTVLGYNNVKVKIGDGYKGWKEHSPFDAIIVTCAPTHVPQPLKDQLAEGGRLVIPVGETHTQELILFEMVNNKFRKKDIIPVRFVPMINEDGENY
jgi:protein-L-isoaspartate(D-aspartate) O-methyltransferase